MPHVKLLGTADLARFHREFHPRALREEGIVLKAEECYLSSQGGLLLVECSVVEGHLRQGFLITASAQGDESIVRLSSRTHPEKTDGVLRCVAWIGAWLQAGAPGTSFVSTNLDPVLARPFPSESLAP